MRYDHGMHMRAVGIAASLAVTACGAPSTPAPASSPSPPSNIASTGKATAVHVGCDTLTVDLFAGTVNGLPATAPQDEVKATLPCSTGDSPDGELWNFGGGVFFTDHELYVYTGNDFVEVREGFTGTVIPPLLGASPATAARELGTPLGAQDGAQFLYDHAPGCVAIHHDDVTITAVSTHFRSCAEVRAMFEEG